MVKVAAMHKSNDTQLINALSKVVLSTVSAKPGMKNTRYRKKV